MQGTVSDPKETNEQTKVSVLTKLTLEHRKRLNKINKIHYILFVDNVMQKKLDKERSSV